MTLLKNKTQLKELSNYSISYNLNRDALALLNVWLESPPFKSKNATVKVIFKNILKVIKLNRKRHLYIL